MSRIEIKRNHTLSLAEAKKQADRMAEHLKREFELHSEWDGDTLRFKRQGVTGAMKVTHRDVHVYAELGFLLAFLKPKIEAQLHEHFDSAFVKAGKADKAKKTAAKSTASRGKAKSSQAGGKPRA
jgi:putative polyhydroxyalkanoate system protein